MRKTNSALIVFLFLVQTALFSNAKAFCVKTKQVYLREQPSPNAKITWTVGRYMPLDVVKSDRKWYQVKDVDGQLHWILKSNISKKMSCGVVKVKIASLRTKPMKNSPKSEPALADKYTPFLRIKESDNSKWIRVEDSAKNKSWIYADNLWYPLRQVNLNY